jgi:hypothetical protein
VICRGDKSSVQRVFEEYERLTCRPRLELNAEKTEILALNPGRSLNYDNRKTNQLNKITEAT